MKDAMSTTSNLLQSPEESNIQTFDLPHSTIQMELPFKEKLCNFDLLQEPMQSCIDMEMPENNYHPEDQIDELPENERISNEKINFLNEQSFIL